MNERIKLLIEQSYDTVEYNYSPSKEFFNKQKFAELIVRECCLQVADVRIENDFEPVGDAVLVQALTGIKQYFGVEE